MKLHVTIKELISKKHQLIRAFEENKVNKYIYCAMMSIIEQDIKELNIKEIQQSEAKMWRK